MEESAKIYVAGGHTLIGAAIRRELQRRGYVNLLCGPGEEPDLTNPVEVNTFFSRATPEYVFLAAGKSGGISANQRYPADLMRDNLLVACNVIHSAYLHRVEKLLYLASSCSYPKHCPQPMRVESLLSGPLEPTNEAYAVAKIAGIKLSQAYRQQYGVNFISAIPADVFGPGDEFSPEDSHVIPALMRRMHTARLLGAEAVEIWGTGNARREFIFADDLAEACLFLMRDYDSLQPINIGGGADLSIAELAALLREVVGYSGALRFDTRRADGMPLKVLDSGPLQQMGWRAKQPFQAALAATFEWFLQVGREGGLHVHAADGSGGAGDIP